MRQELPRAVEERERDEFGRLGVERESRESAGESTSSRLGPQTLYWRWATRRDSQGRNRDRKTGSEGRKEGETRAVERASETRPKKLGRRSPVGKPRSARYVRLSFPLFAWNQADSLTPR